MGSPYTFETLAVDRDSESPKVLVVALNRPTKLNSMNYRFWVEMKQCMDAASTDPDVHCVVVHGGTSRVFTAGLDLEAEMSGNGVLDAVFSDADIGDVSRRGLRMDAGINVAQNGISCIENCRKPVVVALHNAVIGGGVDLATAADIRYCSQDTFFSIAEVNVGLAADVGTLQRLPKIVGNDSVVRELALTGRKLSADEALALGLVGKILPDRQTCLKEALDVARLIASKSPVAVIGTKVSLNYSRDHSTQDGLDHIRSWNTLHLQSSDLKTAIQAQQKKQKPDYSRL